jgi:ATP-dependent RNA helicase DDX31/DBP7
MTETDLSGSGFSPSPSTPVLFIGSYRDTKEDSSPALTRMIDLLKSTAEVTEIAVCGFDSDTLNEVVSESLCLPMRKTKALSEIILAKTEGVPIHIVEVSSSDLIYIFFFE